MRRCSSARRDSNGGRRSPPSPVQSQRHLRISPIRKLQDPTSNGFDVAEWGWTMKHLLKFLGVVALLMSPQALLRAETRLQLHLEGTLADLAGKPIEGPREVTMRIYAEETGGQPLWEEGQTLDFDNGLFSAALGATTPFADDLFDAGTLFLAIQISGDDEMEPRFGLFSVPWAFRAETAVTAQSLVDGAVTASALGAGAVTSVTIAPGAVGSPQLSATGVAPGSYINTNITVGADGRISAASNGSSGGGGGGGGGSINADSINFTELADSMALDASTSITADGTEVLTLTNTGTGLSFVVEDQASDSTPFVIDQNGNVGIGNSSPQFKLHVSGTTSLDSNVDIEGVTTFHDDAYFQNPVGMGTTSPSAPLHVKGNADQVQQIVQANSTQTASIQQWKDSGGNVLASVGGNGEILATSGLAVGFAGVPMTKVLAATKKLDFPPRSLAGCDDLTMTEGDTGLLGSLLGASVGDAVSLGIPHDSVPAHYTFTAWVSADKTVTVRACNIVSVAADPIAGTFRVVVTRF
jgi:hypothetical protein